MKFGVNLKETKLLHFN